jgi:uncharacterized membrane protein YczE
VSEPDYSAVLLWPGGAELRRRLPRLLGGIAALGFGIALTLDAGLGVSPWDVLHQGVARRTGLTFGTVVVLTGLVVLALWIPLGQRLGIGTVVNTLTVGYLVDLALFLEPEPTVLVWRWAYLLAGIVIAALGMAAYIGAGLGPGPRDGLMTGLAARGLPVWLVRTSLEVTVLIGGWVLGGDVGVGTVLFALGIGPLGHWFLARLHLGAADRDPDPDATFGE